MMPLIGRRAGLGAFNLMRWAGVGAVLAATAAAAALAPARAALPPDPATLLLAPADLPPGYGRADSLENADATARSLAYAGLVTASAFAGYRTERAAVVHYVARLRRRADVGTFMAGEEAAVARSHEAARLTLSVRYGDTTNLAYQARGSRGEVWVSLLFAEGRYVTMLGVYDAAGEDRALATLPRLATAVAARLRAAAARAPDPTATPGPRPKPQPALRIVALVTTTCRGRPADVFRPRSTVYWRVLWRIARMDRNARETLREWVARGGAALYSNGLTDRPYPGDNALADHVQLRGAAPGRYTIAVSITLGRLSARAGHSFQVVPAPLPRQATARPTATGKRQGRQAKQQAPHVANPCTG